MEHLKNILAGVGDVLTAFGTAPSYRYPQIGDRATDARRLNGDWKQVGRSMNKALKKEKEVRHGAINDCTTAR